MQDCALCELHPGESDGLTWQEVIERFGVPEWDTDPARRSRPGARAGPASSARAVGGRAGAGRRGIRASWWWPPCHAGVIESTMIAFLQIPPAVSRRGAGLRIVHASLTEWEWVPTESRWVLIRFNDACGVPTA